MSKPRDLFREGFTAADFISLHTSLAEYAAIEANAIFRQALEQAQTVYGCQYTANLAWGDSSGAFTTHTAKLVAIKAIKGEARNASVATDEPEKYEGKAMNKPKPLLEMYDEAVAFEGTRLPYKHFPIVMMGTDEQMKLINEYLGHGMTLARRAPIDAALRKCVEVIETEIRRCGIWRDGEQALAELRKALEERK